MKWVKRRWAEAVLILFAVASLVVLMTFHFRPCPSVDFSIETNLADLDGPSDGQSLPALQAKVRQLGPEAVSYVFGEVRQGRVSFGKAAASLTVLGSMAVPALVRGMDDRCDAVRLVATRTIIGLGMSGQLEPQAEKLVPALIKRLHDRRPEVRYCAILALLNFGPTKERAIPTLVEVLTQTNGLCQADLVCIQQGAAYALGRIGPKAKPAIPALNKLLKDERCYARQQAGVALWRITHDSNLVLPLVSRMLNHTNTSAQCQAAGVLHCMRRETEMSADLITKAEATKRDIGQTDITVQDRHYWGR